MYPEMLHEKKYHRIKTFNLEPKSKKNPNFDIKVVLNELRLYKQNVIFVISENEYIWDIPPYMGIVMVYRISGYYAQF